MAGRTGTLGISPFVIQDDTIPQPAVYSDHVQGGHHSGVNIAARNALETHHRQFGMFYTVYNDGVNTGTYVLKYGKTSTNLADNGNWELFASASGGAGSAVQKIDQSINGSGSINLPAGCILYMVLINAAAPLPAASAGWLDGTDTVVMQQSMASGYNPFLKGQFIATPTTLYFNGIDTQSTCSVIIFQF
jgi:hypothetical protein